MAKRVRTVAALRAQQSKKVGLKEQVSILETEVEQLNQIIQSQKTEITRQNINQEDCEKRIRQLTDEVDSKETGLETLRKRHQVFLDAVAVFQKIVPMPDVRDRIAADLLSLQPSLLARHLYDDAENIPGHALQKIPLDIRSTVIDHFRNDRKIPAIKALRDYTKLGLKEAKDIIDGLWDYLKRG
jgi:TolA-binding protein